MEFKVGDKRFLRVEYFFGWLINFGKSLALLHQRNKGYRSYVLIFSTIHKKFANNRFLFILRNLFNFFFLFVNVNRNCEAPYAEPVEFSETDNERVGWNIDSDDRRGATLSSSTPR